jgi:hypothetical protein
LAEPGAERSGSPSRCVEAAWSVVLQPGPLHGFCARTRARRGDGKAIVDTARNLAILFWQVLTRGEHYAHQQPSLTRKKLRRLELTAGAPETTRTAAGTWSTNHAMRPAERQTRRASRALPHPTGQRPTSRNYIHGETVPRPLDFHRSRKAIAAAGLLRR